MRFITLCLVCVACGLASNGCTPGYPEMAPVHGDVILNGAPLTGGEIVFTSEDGPEARGRIEEDGTYRLTTFQPDDGAMPGTYRVSILPVSSSSPYGGVTMVAIPLRYQDPETSGLTAEVRPGANQIPFNLTTEEPGEDAATEGNLPRAP